MKSANDDDDADDDADDELRDAVVSKNMILPLSDVAFRCVGAGVFNGINRVDDLELGTEG